MPNEVRPPTPPAPRRRAVAALAALALLLACVSTDPHTSMRPTSRPKRLSHGHG